MKNPQQSLEFDRQHIWHPYASMTDPSPVYPVVSASGAEITLANGQKLVDGMSSWWAAIHGYNHPRLNAALEQQAKAFSHVMFGGLTHQPAIALCQRLLQLCPQNLQHVFLADSGSVSVEVALKMAIQYWAGRGLANKQQIITVRNGYHGDTFGAMAVCDPKNGMHRLFSNVLPKQHFAPAPYQGESVEDNRDIEAMAELLETHASTTAAVIIEPIVQGAGGMRIYRANYLKQLHELCEQQNVLLILDEIATGFGRSGTMFACEQAEIEPDIMCVGKALTGGYMTMAATLVTGEVAEGICASEAGALMHGPTYMGNALACAVANASLELLQSGDWRTSVSAIEQQLKQQLEPCRNSTCVSDVRVKGAIGVVELTRPDLIHDIQPLFVERGVWVRPFRNLIYVMPPYIITPEQLSRLCQAIVEIVQLLEEKMAKFSPLSAEC